MRAKLVIGRGRLASGVLALGVASWLLLRTLADRRVLAAECSLNRRSEAQAEDRIAQLEQDCRERASVLQTRTGDDAAWRGFLGSVRPAWSVGRSTRFPEADAVRLSRGPVPVEEWPDLLRTLGRAAAAAAGRRMLVSLHATFTPGGIRTLAANLDVASADAGFLHEIPKP